MDKPIIQITPGTQTLGYAEAISNPSPQDYGLAVLTKAASMLAEVKTLQQAKDLKTLAMTAMDWAKRKGLGEEAISYARSIALDAERKMGEMLRDSERQKPGQYKQKPNGNTSEPLEKDSGNLPPTLAEIGITKRESADAQKLADLPEDEFQKVQKGEKKKKKAIGEQVKKKKTDEIKQKEAEYEPEKHIVIMEGDIFDMLEKIPDKSMDLLNTDPPYFVLKEGWDTFKTKEEFLLFTEKWLTGAMPKVKDTGRAYISFCPDYQYDFFEILKKNDFFGFNLGRTIIWYYKNNNKMFCQDQYRISYEPIFYLFGKDSGRLNFTPDTFGETQQNVWEIATPQSNFHEGKYHAAQKPLELYRRIITTGCKEGDSVLDCFGGSGTSAIVCKTEKRKCITIEKDAENIKIIKGRLA